MPKVRAYTVEEQLGWDVLPPELSSDELAAEGVDAKAVAEAAAAPATPPLQAAASGEEPFVASAWGATVPPWSAAHAYTNLYGPKTGPTTASVVGNFKVNEAGTENETHHIVLDLGSMPFPVLEGQSIAVIPPGVDAHGKPHHARQYSIASPRNGERPGYNNLSLTIKRVLADHQGQPVRGVASNYMCDLQVGDTRARTS
jgi:benzoyl-CoA 2,3-dioxygenase component A